MLLPYSYDSLNHLHSRDQWGWVKIWNTDSILIPFAGIHTDKSPHPSRGKLWQNTDSTFCMRYQHCETIDGLEQVLAEEARKSLSLLSNPIPPTIIRPPTSNQPSISLLSTQLIILASTLFLEHTRHILTSLLSSQKNSPWHIWLVLVLISEFLLKCYTLKEWYLDYPIWNVSLHPTRHWNPLCPALNFILYHTVTF